MNRPHATAPVAARTLPLIDLGKALASQLIVWHHLAFYSPMRHVVDPLAPTVFEWLADSARLAVQLFLVMAGFLAARSLIATPGAPAPFSLLQLPQRLWRRYRRLAPPALVAIALALVAAALARQISDDPGIPSAPSWRQLWANLLFMQDIVGEEALSAGLWYVAIDLQLFALMLLLVGLRWMLDRLGLRSGPATLVVVSLGAAYSLLWINLHAGLDMWAGYFFGAYGLGVMACWCRRREMPGHRRVLAMLAMAALVLLALWWQWRSRVALAGVVALCLIAVPQGPWMQRLAARASVAWLARCSYAIFLVHYPVCLLVSAAVQVIWPDSLALNAMGLLLAWSLSLAAGGLLHELVEQRHLSPRRRAAATARNQSAATLARA